MRFEEIPQREIPMTLEEMNEEEALDLARAIIETVHETGIYSKEEFRAHGLEIVQQMMYDQCEWNKKYEDLLKRINLSEIKGLPDCIKIVKVEIGRKATKKKANN